MMSTKTVSVFHLIPPSVHLLDISGPAHVFYEAKDEGAAIDSIFLSLDEQDQQVSTSGLSFNQLEQFKDYQLTANDVLIVPGLDKELLLNKEFAKKNNRFSEWLQVQASNQAKICSICTGAYLLAYAGLLDGIKCTTHWKYLADFRKRFPKAILQNDRLFVKEGNIYTSAGVSSGIDLSLYLLEELYGPIFTTHIAKEIVVYLRRAEEDPQLSVFLQYRNHIENRIHKVQDHLAQHLDISLKIDDLATLVNTSSRNLTRLFKKTTGITIGQYVDKLRVERAVQLIADGHKVEAVSVSCGLSSSNQLRTLLKKYRQALPRDLSQY